RLSALEDRIEADLARGLHRAVVAELEALIAEHPLRERLRRQLMLALYRSGRQAEALRVYRETRGILVGALGIEPGPELEAPHKAILRHEDELTWHQPASELAAPETPREAAQPASRRPSIRPRTAGLVITLLLATATALAFGLRGQGPASKVVQPNS